MEYLPRTLDAPRQAPLPSDWVIVWRVVESCSLACRFCGFSRDLKRSRLAADVREVLSFGKVLAELQQRLGTKILVSWLGGEPLEWAELPALARAFREDLGLSLGVTTHGLLLSRPSVRAELLAHYEQITVSIDGLAPQHDWARGRPGMWEQLRRGIVDLKHDDSQGSLWRRVNTVLMRGNIGQFVPFCREMATWGFHELTFNQLGGDERPEFFPANRLLPEQLSQFRRDLAELRRSDGLLRMIVRGADAYLQRIESSARNEPLPIADCEPGRKFLFIDAQGRISPCSFTGDAYGVPISGIDSVPAFLRLAERFDEARRRGRSPACEDCRANHVFDKFGSDSPATLAALA